MYGPEGTDAVGSRIQVLVRVRPPIGTGITEELAVACSPSQEHVQVLVPERLGEKPQLPSHSSVKAIAKKFTLDACLDGAVSQESIAVVCNIEDLVDGALQGFPVTVFAFGQTGSGKTYSMIGPRLGTASFDKQEILTEADGLLARAYSNVYDNIKAEQDNMHVSVRASCCEIYHDQVSDLAPGSKQSALPVRHDKHRGFFVEGLTEVPCDTCLDALTFMHKALTTRHVRSTRLNEYSSRGHCIMTLQFETTPLLSANPGNMFGHTASASQSLKKYGKLVLVDLAGSERLKAAGNDVEAALKETGSINKSLFTLGQVLAGLSMRRNSSFSSVPPVIPYRDSTLTKLLYEGLKGNGRVLMMACCSPSKAQAEETLNTLHFASMALRVKCNPLCILDPQDKLVLGLRGTITKLKQENQQLSTALQRSRSNSNSGSRDSARRAKAEAEYQQRSIWDLPNTQPAQRSTLDLMPLNTYPSLINSPRPNAVKQNPGLAMEPSQDYGSLSGMDDDAWAANQVSALRGMKSADFSVPYGSSPQRVRIMQDDYNAYEPKRDVSPKRSSPPRGAQQSGVVDNISPSRRDISPKHSRSVARGPFVLSPNASAFSLSTLPSTLQASGAAQQMLGVEAFPELAAMEAEFQANLARGPSKPSLIPEPSSLQLNSFSQGPWSPEQLLRRSGLSLGSGLRTGPSQKSSKGFDRGSAAGGILDQLQMPNRLGLKFPNRNFGREKAARPASPVLAPLPSPPVPSSPLRSPPKPASNTDGNVAAASSGKQTASAAAASQKAPSVTSAADSEPEHKRRLHSRFTEEHLIQLLPDRGTAPIRELPNSPAAQPSIEAESEPPAQHAVSMQTQTSTVQELALDSDMPLHGFRRHMSLRDPLVGIEQLNAVVASRQLRHESAGSSNDDIMASAQQAAIARRRSSADRLNIAQSNNSVDTQPLVASVDVATAQDSAASPATEESQAEPATEAEAADEADESLAYSQSAAVPTGSASMVDDSYISAQRDIAVDAAVDAVQTDAVQQFEAGVVADANDVVDQLNTEAVDASHTEQDETVGDIVSQLTLETADSSKQQDSAAVDSTLNQLGEEVAQQSDDAATDTVISVLGELRRDTAEHYARQVSSHIDSTVDSLTAETDTGYKQQASSDVDGTLQQLRSDAEAAFSTDAASAVDGAVNGLLTGAAEEHSRQADAEVDSSLAGLGDGAARHYARNSSLAVNSVIADISQSAALAEEQHALRTATDVVDTFAAEAVASEWSAAAQSVDETLGQLQAHAVDYEASEAAAAAAAVISDLEAEAVAADDVAVADAVDDVVGSLQAQTAAGYSQQADLDVALALDDVTTAASGAADIADALAVDALVQSIGTDTAAYYRRQDSALVNSTVEDLASGAVDSFAHDQSVALDGTMNALTLDAVQHYRAEQDSAIDSLLANFGDDTAAHHAAAEESEVADLMDDLQSQAAAHEAAEADRAAEAATESLAVAAVEEYNLQQDAAVAAVLDSLGAESAMQYDQHQDAAVATVMDTLGVEIAEGYDRQQDADVAAVVDTLGAEANRAATAHATAVVNATLRSLQADTMLAEQQQVTASVTLAVDELASTVTQLTDDNDTTAVEAATSALADSAIEHAAAEQYLAVDEAVASIGDAAHAHINQEEDLAIEAAVSTLSDAAVEHEQMQQGLQRYKSQQWQTRHAKSVPPEVLAFLGKTGVAYFSAEEEAVLQSALQDLTIAALGTEEEDRNAAVHQILTALSGDIEGEVRQSLRENVDTMIDSIRAEVAASSDAEAATAVEDALQGMEGMAVAHYSRQQSLTVDNIVDSLTLEAAASYGGTRKPAASQALKKQLRMASQRLPSLAAVAAASSPPVPDLPAAAVASDAVDDRSSAAAAPAALPPIPDLPAAAVASDTVDDRSSAAAAAACLPPLPDLPAAAAASEAVEEAADDRPTATVASLPPLPDLPADVALEAETDAAAIPQPQVTEYRAATVIECHAMCPEADVPIDQLPPQLREEVRRICPRINSLSSINALLWPESRRISSSSGGRASDADIDTLMLARDILQLQSEELAASQPPVQRLRTTASINALVWPSSRSASAHSSGSRHAAAADDEDDSQASVKSNDGSVTEQGPHTASRALPSAEDIDEVLWPGSNVLGDSPAVHALVVSQPQQALHIQTSDRTAGTAGAPDSPTRRARTLQTHQRSLLDRAAAKRALASLLAAAKASQIRIVSQDDSPNGNKLLGCRGWRPKSLQPVAGPVPAERAVPGLPSLEDIEALVPIPDTRNDTLEDSAFEPVAKPAEPDIEALPENSDPHALSDDPVMSAVPEIFEHPQELPQQPAESSDAAVEAVLADMQNATEAAVAEQQAVESLEVLEEAIQAAALEADFTFPDDTSSSHGDQSLVIDDIIESLEIDAMEAEQEALLVQRAEEEAQAQLQAQLQAEEDARAAVRAEQEAQAARQAEAARHAQAEALAAVAAAEALQAARRAEEEERLAQQARAEEQARVVLQEQAIAAKFAHAVVVRAVSLAQEEEARAAELAAEEEARLAQLAAEEEARLAQLAAEEEARLAQLAAVEQARLAQLAAEQEARLAQLTAEEQARAAQMAAQEAIRARQLAAEEEAMRVEAEARAAQLAAEEARAARLAAEEEARVRQVQAEEEARAAQLAAEEDLRARALAAAEEARAAHDVVFRAVSLAKEEEAKAAVLAREEADRDAQQAAEAERKAEEEKQAGLRAEEEERKAKEAKQRAVGEAAAMAAMMLGKPQHSHTNDIAAAIDQEQAASMTPAGPLHASKALASIPEEGSGELAGRIPAANNKIAAEYSGLEAELLPEAAPLFKFKGQAFPEDENRADRIAAGAAQEMAVYNMMANTSPTFREMPLDPAISISPRQTLRNSLLGRTSSSIGTQSSFQQREDQDLRRSRSSLMQRSGSTMSQFVDPEGRVTAEAPEPLALQWAARNPWFGTDSEMTYYAYEVHDQLIEQEGLDPNSAEYYEQIGIRVEQRFPERYVERSVQPTPRLADVPTVVNNSLRQMSLPKSGRTSPFDPSKPIPSPKQTPPKLSPAPSAPAKPQNPVRRNTSGSSQTSSSSYTGSSYTGSSYTGSSYTGSSYTGSSNTGSSYTSTSYITNSRSATESGSRSSVTRTTSGGSYSRRSRSGSESGSFTTATGTDSQSRSTSGDGSRTATSSSYSSRNVSARSAGQPPVAPGQGIRSRQIYSQSGSGSSYTTASDSRTTSASSYTSVTSSLSTDRPPAASRLPAISTAQAKPKATNQTTVVQKSTAVTSAAKAPYRGRPVSSGSESGSESSYTSSGSGASDSSDRNSPASSSGKNQTPTLPKLPSPQKPGQALQKSKTSTSPNKRTTADRLVVAGMVTQPSRKSLSASGSESSSFSSISTSTRSTSTRDTSGRNTARGTNLPAIAGSPSKSPPTASNASWGSSSQTVQQQQELARSSLQQSRAAAEQEKARIKNSIQQQLRPGKMLF